MIQNLLPYSSSLFDWFDWIFRKSISRMKNGEHVNLSKPPRPYKILMSVYNLEGRLDEVLERFDKYLDKIIMIDDASSDKTVQKAREYGLEIIPCAINKHKPQEIRHIMAHLDPSIESVIVMDPDTVFLERYKGKSQTLEEAVSWQQQMNANATAVNMRVKNENLITKLQDVEYNITMVVGRKALLEDSVISGGCAIFDRKSLDMILEEHSGSVLAEDYETSIRMLRKNGRIVFNKDFVVETEGPNTIRKFTKQRIWWDESIIKVLFESLWMKRNPKLSSKKRRRLREIYNHYIYNWGLDVLAHPIKLAGIPLVGMSALNGLEKLANVNYLPETLNTPIGYINVGPEVLGLFYGSYVLLSGINVLTNGLPKKRKYAAAVLTYPFYKIYQLTVPRTIGFTKGLGNILVKLKKKPVDFVLPKNYYENFSSNDFQPKIEDININSLVKIGQEEYKILFYKTDYHDLYIVEFQNIPQVFDKLISSNGEKRFLGIDMEDKYIRIVPFQEAKRFFPKLGYQKVDAEPYKMHCGLVCRRPKEDGAFIIYKELFKDGRKTPIYLMKKGKKGKVQFNKAVEVPKSYEQDFSKFDDLSMSLYRNISTDNIDFSIHKKRSGGQHG